jgi:pimeloyl-ACP methyl ester carboxylesterase
VLEALAAGSRAAGLAQYFGAPAHAELAALARRASRTASRRGPPVIILPGIMGSTLGEAAAPGAAAAGAVWIDPGRIARGGLLDLALPAGRRLKPLGVLTFAYARLTLQLRSDGLDARLHAYDWRLGIDELGRDLAARIAAAREPVILIGHSMGGLVARMAMRMLPRRCVRKLIMLGTPNRGSFAPVLAIRGTYPFVREVARLDPEHSVEHLARTVFRTFSGLYDMLPPRGRGVDIDLHAAGCWPARGPRPDARLLRQALATRRRLAPPDPRMSQIVGVNRETIVGVRRVGARFVYEIGLNGDGTVPLALARLAAVKTYYVEEMHGNLASNPLVIAAIRDLIRLGRTHVLPRRWRRRAGAPAYVDDRALTAGDGPKIDWQGLAPDARDAVLRQLNEGGRA